MNEAILSRGGTGDAVPSATRFMAVFGGGRFPPARSRRPLASTTRASRCIAHRRRSTPRWIDAGLSPFPLGIGLSSGQEAAAALLGSEERLEYTIVGGQS